MRLLPLFALPFLACAPKPVEAPPPAAAPAPLPPPLAPYAQAMLDARDTSVNPCDDFYQYACGTWLKTTQMPSDKPTWTRSFSVIHEDNVATLKAVLDEVAANPGTDPDRQRLGAFYGSCMDEAAANTAGLTPLQPYVDGIRAIKDAGGFMEQVGKLSDVGADPFMAAYTDGDYKNPDVKILYLTQGGLSFPDKKYYDTSDAKNAALLTDFQALVSQQLARLGEKDTDKLAAKVLAFETGIANAWMAREDVRDPTKTYHKIDRTGLLKLTPGLKWDRYLAGMGAADVTQINVETPDTFKAMEKLVKKTDLPTLKAYLEWHLVKSMAPALDNDTYMAMFDLFRGKVRGQKEPEARWKRCVNATDGAIGELVGKAYVDKKFAGDSKPIALSMIKDIEGAFSDGLGKLSWMDDATRTKAVEKMGMILNKIGYPDQWRDYSKLTLAPGKWAENYMAANHFETARQIGKVGNPSDRNEWLMTPSMVNAYYNPTTNEMAFPAGILQPPFFSKDFPTAFNYGAIGMVMGHELTHGFDDQGAKFNGKGEMVDWWSPEVVKNFEERTSCVSNQYDGYEVQPGLKVNGKLTNGENIADIGGLHEAYRAYKAHPGTAANVPGLTDDQVFFLAFAQGWCTISTPELEKERILTDPHSPPKFRVNGPAVDTPEFAAAFGCSAGAPMAPTNRCEIW